MARYLAAIDTVTIPTTVTDRNGTLTDASAISLVMHQPDGTVKTYSSPTHDSVGVYHQDLPLTDTTPVGHYPYVWQVTVGGTVGGGQVGSFEVYDPFEVSVLSLQDAKDMLNIPQTTTTDDAEIRRKIATITTSIESGTTGGPIITRQINNERVRVGTGYRTLTVRQRPLVSVVSITDVASPATVLSLADIEIDTVAGIIRRRLQLPFWSWGPYYLITYTAGLGTAVPAGIQEAAALILDYLWQTQRAGAAATFAGQETIQPPGWDYPIPARAAWALAPFADEAYV